MSQQNQAALEERLEKLKAERKRAIDNNKIAEAQQLEDAILKLVVDKALYKTQ